MASSGNERRMVFDIRGRRKNVVKVVYAILALLMGASLFLAVGPVNIGSILGSSNESSDASAALIEQADKVEQKLKKDPENPDLLVALTKSRISAGNAMAELNPETGAAEVTAEGRVQLEKASEAWSRYLKATDEPTVGVAQSAASMLFSLASTSRTIPETEANVQAAKQAQQIVAEQRPSLGTLSTLGYYQNFAFDFDGAKQSLREAEKLANTKFERENLGNEFEQIEKRAKEFQKEVVRLEKEATKARKEGKPSLANPLSESNPLASP
ncbi:MAG: hypothetical protein ABW065_08550 [Solirubrobacterales bacterium]